MTLRTFQNDDLPSLVRIWQSHYQAAGIDVAVSSMIFERAVLNRLFFRAEQIIVACQNGQPVGFAIWSFAPRHADQLIVSAVCVASPQHASGCGIDLLQACEQVAIQGQASQVFAGLRRQDEIGLIGLPPLGPAYAVPNADRAAAGWMMHLGYTPAERIGRYRVDLSGFRPPVDRSQLQLRRSTALSSHRVLPDNLQAAAALVHIDIERFRSTSRGGEVCVEADFYLSAPEAQVFPAGHAFLADWKSVTAENREAATRFTLAAALGQLAERGVSKVEAGISDTDPEKAVLLRALRFDLYDEGTVFAKQIAPRGNA